MRWFARLTRRQKQVLYLLLPLVALLLLFLTRSFWIWVGRHMPPCAFYRVTGLYCPGCGNTRSVLSLLDGHIWQSLRYNITPILLTALGVLWYAEQGFALFDRPRRLLPRWRAVWIPAGLLLLAYFIIRNVWEFMPL